MPNENLGVILVARGRHQTWSLGRYARSLRREGYQVSCVDMNPRGYSVRPSYARRNLRESADQGIVVARINWEGDELTQRGCTRIAVLGFGSGAVTALRSALQRPLPPEEDARFSPDGIIGFYPRLISEGSTEIAVDLDKVACPILLIFGSRDESLPIAQAAHHKALSIKVRSRVGGPFAERFTWGFVPSPRYHRRAALRSWEQVLGWLQAMARAAKP